MNAENGGAGAPWRPHRPRAIDCGYANASPRSLHRVVHDLPRSMRHSVLRVHADVLEKGQRSPLSPASLSACERALSLGAHRLLTRASTAAAWHALSLRWPLTSNLLHRLRSPLMHPLPAAHTAAVAHAFALVHFGCVEHIPKATPGAAHIRPGRVCSRTADSLVAYLRTALHLCSRAHPGLFVCVSRTGLAPTRLVII